MSYTLERLATGSYDVVLDGRVVASLVRAATRAMPPGQLSSCRTCHRGRDQRRSLSRSTRSRLRRHGPGWACRRPEDSGQGN